MRSLTENDMAKRVKGHAGSGEEISREPASFGESGRHGEVWRVARSGRFVTLRTSGDSVRAMDEALTKYDRALKSLANR
jgi:hypothetical protein